MKDFNSFSGEEKKQSASDDAVDMAKMMAKAFEGKGEADILRAIYKEAERGRKAGTLTGKGEADILRAIYKEAERGRKAGTLTDSDLDNFYAALYPMLDSAKRKKLEQVINKLKKM